MNAGACPGVWYDDIFPGVTLIAYTQLNLIVVKNNHGNNLTYHCKDGISIDDVEQVKQSILKTTKLTDLRLMAN